MDGRVGGLEWIEEKKVVKSFATEVGGSGSDTGVGWVMVKKEWWCDGSIKPVVFCCRGDTTASFLLPALSLAAFSAVVSMMVRSFFALFFFFLKKLGKRMMG
jgi:hypothetical protein